MSDDFPTSVPAPFALCIREEIPSTNDDARLLAERGAAGGTVVIAKKQTAGRGRRGADWFADPEGALAFSVVIRPGEPKALWPRLALAAGLAVAEAVETRVPLAGIKWPNDVWISGRKVAGILVEAGADFAVVGVGVNLNVGGFPGELAEIATSVGREAGAAVHRGEFLSELLRRFAFRSGQIGGGFGELLDAVRQRCVLTGRDVELTTYQGRTRGRAEGIGPGGELLLRTVAGIERIIQADEVRLSDVPPKVR
ncbi:MAG: biotin--[acetyl-CoA-carboxylase] ligase [Verrucomicrobia bacterium]|nr:biotin--[acetyl-CoA-carboxylase] ligase [Verrucomicrobiota bacterium]